MASSRVIGVQTMPEVWRTMKAIFSGVQCTAATIMSPFVLAAVIIHDDDDLATLEGAQGFNDFVSDRRA